MKNAKVFEVDLATVQDDKKKKLQKYLGRLPDYVSFIPIDFDKQTLEAVFTETTFNPTKPAIFIWEGVTQYISEQAVRQTLAFLGKSAPGSIIVFTYVLKSIIERRSDIPEADHLMEVVAKQSPWVFGLEPSLIPDFLKPYHLSLIAEVGNVDYQEKYPKPVGRNLVVFEGERIVQATVRCA
jgi:methyltransferase (TIGR00027 family)